MHQDTTSPLSLIKKEYKQKVLLIQSEYLTGGWWFLKGYRCDCSLAILEGDEFEAVLSVPVPLSGTVVGSVTPEEINTSSSWNNRFICSLSNLILVTLNYLAVS